MKPLNPKDDEKNAVYREVGPLLGMGINLAVTIVLSVLLGNWLDTHFEKKEPFYLLICSGVGIFVGMYHFIKTALQIEKKMKK